MKKLKRVLNRTIATVFAISMVLSEFPMVTYADEYSTLVTADAHCVCNVFFWIKGRLSTVDDLERKLDRARYVLLNWINVPNEYFH